MSSLIRKFLKPSSFVDSPRTLTLATTVQNYHSGAIGANIAFENFS